MKNLQCPVKSLDWDVNLCPLKQMPADYKGNCTVLKAASRQKNIEKCPFLQNSVGTKEDTSKKTKEKEIAERESRRNDKSKDATKRVRSSAQSKERSKRKHHDHHRKESSKTSRSAASKASTVGNSK